MEYNDYELIYMAQESNEDAVNILNKKYESLINSRVTYFYNRSDKKGYDYNDLYQEALLGFNEAIYRYDQDNNATFYTFASVCIDNKLMTFLTKNNTGKVTFYNDAVNYDDVKDNLVGNDYSYSDPLDMALDKERYEEILDKIKGILTDKELSVFELKIQGLSIDEIVKKLNINHKSVYNTLVRIKNKIKEMIIVK